LRENELNGKYVDVNGQNVYYEEYGQGDSLLLLHGGFGTGDSLMALGQILAAHHRVIAPDRSGHGHTGDIEGPLTYDAMATETIGVIEALGIEKANLVGYSDGGILCLLIALQRPDLLSRIVPIAANFHHIGISPQALGMLGSFTPDILRAVLPEAVAAYEKYSPDGPEHFPVMFEKSKQMFITQPTMTVDDLAKINVPTLVIAADHDMMTIEHTVSLFQSIPNAQLCIVPGATHGLGFDRAEDVGRAALRFLLA
jgi:pimeloyl-ACP methyl ester carboxylesterase